MKLGMMIKIDLQSNIDHQQSNHVDFSYRDCLSSDPCHPMINDRSSKKVN